MGDESTTSDAAELAAATRELRGVVQDLAGALRLRKNVRAISECDGGECDKKSKRRERCLFGSPLTCCCWMTVSFIGMFFVIALFGAIFGDSSGGTCPASAGSPQYQFK